MKFCLHADARLTSEKTVGIPCAKQQMTRLDALCKEKPLHNVKSTIRQIHPRGSIYLHLGRKVSIDDMKKIIQDF